MNISKLKTIEFKGKHLTFSELAKKAGKTYGAIASACRQHPELNGEEIIALKRRKEATFEGKTQSLIEWSDDFEVATSTLAKKIQQLGTQNALKFYATGQHLIHAREKYKPKTKKIFDADISSLEFNPDLHAERLLESGLCFEQVARRLNDGRLLS